MLRFILDKIFNRIKSMMWGHKGKNSKVIHPMRIVGKNNIFIADDVTILNNARIETISQWGDDQHHGRVEIGKRTSIEQNCHIIAADRLVIGENCVFSADVYISDCNHRYSPSCHIMQQPLEVKKTKIGNGVFIGIGAKIMPGVTIGDYCVVGANSVVTHDVSANTIVAGIPAKVIGQNFS